MKNLTLALDDQTYQTARVIAAQRSMSLTALVREYLQSLAASAPSDPMGDLMLALDAAQGPFAASRRMSREEAHGRQE
jgi:hypothetical protein